MINEGEAGGEGAGGEGLLGNLGGGEGGGEGLDQPGVIHVSPQDKEAIERVNLTKIKKFKSDSYDLYSTVESSWLPRAPGCPSLLRM